MTPEELEKLQERRKELRKRLKELQEKRDETTAEFAKVTRSAVNDQGEPRDFTGAEAESRGELKARKAHLDDQIEAVEDEYRQAKREIRKAEQLSSVAQMRRELGLAEVPAGSNGLKVTNEPRTYEKGNGQSYLRDLTIQAFGPGLGGQWSQARQRLERHARENHVEALEHEEKFLRLADTERAKAEKTAERYFVRQMIEQFSDRESRRGPFVGSVSYRALSTAATAGGEFVPPMYLTEQWIKFLRAGRVIANCMQHQDLPDGTMSINVPKVVSGTSVAVQGTQNTNVSDTDLTTEYVTFPVVTFAGAQIVSLQLLERSPIQFDEVVMDDLSRAWAQQVDLQVINGSGSNGQVTGLLNTSGINTVTWTQATPTIKGYYGQTGLAKLDVATSLFLPATHQFITPNLWEYISQSFDNEDRPLVVPSYAGPFNVIDITEDTATAEGVVGRGFNGLQTFEDNNLPQNLGSGTNQDVAIICRAQESLLYESPVVTRALPQTYGAQLSVLLQLYNYGAFTGARYPTSISVITGTGMSSANRVFNS